MRGQPLVQHRHHRGRDGGQGPHAVPPRLGPTLRALADPGAADESQDDFLLPVRQQVGRQGPQGGAEAPPGHVWAGQVAHVGVEELVPRPGVQHLLPDQQLLQEGRHRGDRRSLNGSLHTGEVLLQHRQPGGQGGRGQGQGGLAHQPDVVRRGLAHHLRSEAPQLVFLDHVAHQLLEAGDECGPQHLLEALAPVLGHLPQARHYLAQGQGGPVAHVQVPPNSLLKQARNHFCT